jgi:hypothetical protein
MADSEPQKIIVLEEKHGIEVLQELDADVPADLVEYLQELGAPDEMLEDARRVVGPSD